MPRATRATCKSLRGKRLRLSNNTQRPPISPFLKKLRATLRDEPPDQTSSRKADHLRINIDRDVAAKGVASGFDDYAFAHRALPEIDFDEVDTSTEFLGRRLAAPLLISCMTGGTPQA